MEAYLRSTDIIDWRDGGVLGMARRLGAGISDEADRARACFEWVRDEIKHSHDHRLDPVTCTASETLRAGTGYCYAKSHLLAALLRASGLPAGLCYQRLSRDGEGPPYCLHGLVAVRLPGLGWYRADPRGNRADVDAQFTPPVECLAFRLSRPGEADLPEIWPDPAPVVVEALRAHTTWEALHANLPDVPLIGEPPAS